MTVTRGRGPEGGSFSTIIGETQEGGHGHPRGFTGVEAGEKGAGVKKNRGGVLKSTPSIGGASPKFKITDGELGKGREKKKKKQRIGTI